jgi:hypothetical protein
MPTEMEQILEHLTRLEQSINTLRSMVSANQDQL